MIKASDVKDSQKVRERKAARKKKFAETLVSSLQTSSSTKRKARTAAPIPRPSRAKVRRTRVPKSRGLTNPARFANAVGTSEKIGTKVKKRVRQTSIGKVTQQYSDSIHNRIRGQGRTQQFGTQNIGVAGNRGLGGEVGARMREKAQKSRVLTSSLEQNVPGIGRRKVRTERSKKPGVV